MDGLIILGWIVSLFVLGTISLLMDHITSIENNKPIIPSVQIQHKPYQEDYEEDDYLIDNNYDNVDGYFNDDSLFKDDI